jgi:hypothetical protein
LFTCGKTAGLLQFQVCGVTTKRKTTTLVPLAKYAQQWYMRQGNGGTELFSSMQQKKKGGGYACIFNILQI